VITQLSNFDNRLIQPNTSGIEAAALALSVGQIVAFPTETVYGLGANAKNDKAVASIYLAKGRPTFNPLIVHVPSIQAALQYVEVDDRAHKIFSTFCPGALSCVLPRRNDSPLSFLVSAGLDTIAIRIPAHPTAQALLNACQLPIAAPSANTSGAVSPTTALHVLNGWSDPTKKGPSLVIDGINCPIGLESTVLDLTTPTVTLLRPGGISLEDIEAAIGPVVIAVNDETAPKSPGMLSRHYAPNTPIRLNAETVNKNEIFLGFGPGGPKTEFNLSPTGDLIEAAANLFAVLHQLDNLNASSIAVAPIPHTGLGLAINDRLTRATSTIDKKLRNH
jgi:L-threonylcarbamoyladenylate synthase